MSYYMYGDTIPSFLFFSTAIKIASSAFLAASSLEESTLVPIPWNTSGGVLNTAKWEANSPAFSLDCTYKILFAVLLGIEIPLTRKDTRVLNTLQFEKAQITQFDKKSWGTFRIPFRKLFSTLVPNPNFLKFERSPKKERLGKIILNGYPYKY